MHNTLKIEVGERSGWLTVIGPAAPSNQGKRRVRCACDCGAETDVIASLFARGVTKSCGCKRGRPGAPRGPRPRPIRHDLTGQTFGLWTVLGPPDRRPGEGTFWPCRCECGNERAVRAAALRNGASEHCGCLTAERIAARFLKHGNATKAATTREYRIWQSMLNRCRNPRTINYKYYGARGIAVCDRWAESFEAFLADVGPIPEPLSIDRIDVDGNYEPGNIRLATPREQRLNQRRHIK